MLGSGVGFEPPRRFFPVYIRQCEVHENEVRLFCRRHGNAMCPIRCNNDGKARARKPVFQHVDVVVVILDVEYLHTTLAACRLTHLPTSRLSCRSISSRSLF
jgi:hypothetical protein